MSHPVSQLRAASISNSRNQRRAAVNSNGDRSPQRDYHCARAAGQIAAYMAKKAQSCRPTIDRRLERFFDEVRRHATLLHRLSRINRAWGLALRKKFCQGFNFELQAAATEEGIILSLGETHSFPLEEVLRYLHPNTVRETLVQALLQSPIFETRWRWSTTLALAVPRNRGGARIPNQLQRMYAEDLLQAVFPDAVACQDNIQGAREIPYPPRQSALRFRGRASCTGLESQLGGCTAGNSIACDLPSSQSQHELLNSAVYLYSMRRRLKRAARARSTRAAHRARSR